MKTFKIIANYFSYIRHECWKAIEREYPEKKDKYAIVKDLIMKSLRNGYIILDVGCGHRSFTYESHNVIQIGMDLVFDDLRKNKSINFGICADVYRLPFKLSLIHI